MKISRSLVAIGIAIAVVFAFVPVLGQVSAASKKTVYVVKSIKEVEDGKTGTVKLTYNKDGLLTKCVESAEGVTVTYTYGKNGQLKSATEKSKHETVKANYTWKSGKMVKKAGTRDGGDKFSYVIKYRGDKPISSDVTEQWIDDQTGNTMMDKATCKYTYKNGKIVKSTGRMGSVTTFKYDKKGNAIDIKTTMKNEKGETIVPAFAKSKFTYKKNRVVKVKSNYRIGYMEPGKSITNNSTITYKKIKVKKSLVKKIQAQQWSMVNNCIIVDGVPW